MTVVLEVENGRTGYHDVVQHVLKRGIQRAPRGLPTLDAGWTTVILHSPYDALPLGTGRGLSRAIAAAEAAQLIGSFSDPNTMIRIAPAFSAFVEPGTLRFHGAYGSRIKSQVSCALDKIRQDPSTRQAVITLWDPWLDNIIPAPRDIPCTVALRLSVWNDKLDLDVTMRSNDVITGFPYDIFQFSQLLLTCANSLGISPGVYRHTAWSMHLYLDDMKRAEAVRTPAPEAKIEWQPHGLGNHKMNFGLIMSRAQQLMHVDPDNATPSEIWYGKQIRPHADTEVGVARV